MSHLVKQQHPWRAKQRPCNGNPLLLATTEADAPLAYCRVVSLHLSIISSEHMYGCTYK